MSRAGAKETRSLQVVVVLDGLRPDLLGAGLMPALSELAAEGTAYSAARSVAMPVTLVSAASLVTGVSPGATGMLGGRFYGQRSAWWPGLAPTAPTLAERLAASGLRLVTLTTASSVIGRVVNDPSHGQVGVNLGGDGGLPLGAPAAVERELLNRLGPPPSRRSGRHDSALGTIGYAVSSLIDWVLSDLAPDVVVLWCAEPDQTQHRFGVGAPQSRDVLADLDGILAGLWEALRSRRRSGNVELVVCADHGFSALDGTIDLTEQLVGAGLKESESSEDIVVAANGLGLLRVERADARRLADVAEWSAAQPWVGGIFADDRLREVVGGLPIRHLDLDGRADAPHLALAPAWSHKPNEFGANGRSLLLTNSDYPGGRHSGHGTLSPHELHVPLVLWGSRIKPHTVFDAPAGILDVAPTLLALAGAGDRPGPGGGRVLSEAFVGGPAGVTGKREVLTARVGPSAFALEVSAVGAHRYVEGGWRE